MVVRFSRVHWRRTTGQIGVAHHIQWAQSDDNRSRRSSAASKWNIHVDDLKEEIQQ